MTKVTDSLKKELKQTVINLRLRAKKINIIDQESLNKFQALMTQSNELIKLIDDNVNQ